MYYSVTHLTVFKYSDPITDSVMEVRLQPRSDECQRCVRFDLEVRPHTKVQHYKDHMGNVVHTFDVPGQHDRLAIRSESVVDVKVPMQLPDSVDASMWEALDDVSWQPELYDMLLPGQFAKRTSLLTAFAEFINWGRNTDPLTALRQLNQQVYENFDYQQHVTRADSPIDIALEARQGVCQDFSHIMIALARSVGIPSRYVSGYLYQHKDRHDRSDVDASHAWMEAWLPDLGWIGFDPTNNLIVEDRHIRVALGNDYADASPTHGVFRGSADTDLEVFVEVNQLAELPFEDTNLAPDIVLPNYEAQLYPNQPENFAQQQQQQQQQQQD